MTISKLDGQSASRPIRKFNPGTFQSDEEVIEQFVVRMRELDAVLEVLRGNVDSPSCQHVLVVGPRGRGKTMLLVRVASELRTDKSLARRLFPVRFMEESQEIFDLADFWLEALFHLARETEERDPILSRDLHKTHGDLSSRWREQSLEAHARAAVLEAADRLDRKLVLMVENMQSLCENVDDDFGWKLRGALQSEPEIMLLATATTKFEGLDDADQPFFELFRTINLQQLDTDECRLLWQVVSGDTVSSREIRPLQILTGGNPRLLVIVAEFARHRSLRKLMEELVTLIDEHTEYFRGHLEVLAKTERRVYISVIDLWQPSSAGEIATRARMDVRVVSTMLGRLVERGAVIAEGRGRKRLYAPAEPLYCIYYKLRRERDEAAVVENLIHFMVTFYGIHELDWIRDQLYSEAIRSKIFHAGLGRALAVMQPVEDVESRTKWDIVRDAADKVATYRQGLAERQIEEDIIAAFQERDWQKAIEIVNEVFKSRNAASLHMSEAFIARVLYCKAEAQEQLRQFHAVISTCEEVVARFGESALSDLQRWVAVALIVGGRAKKELGDLVGAIEACEEVAARIGTSTVSYHQELVAEALLDMERMRSELGDLVGAVAVCEEVVARFGKSEKADVRWRVAAALVDKGRAKKELGDPDRAIATWDEVIEQYGDTMASGVEWLVALALIEKGRAINELGDQDGAIAMWDEVVRRYGDTDVSDVHWWVAQALIDKGSAIEKLGDADGAIAVWDELVRRYSDTDVSDLQQRVVVALVNKGMRQAEMGRSVESLRVCDELETRICALPESEDRRHNWGMLCVRALAFMVEKKQDAALQAFRSAFAEFAHRNEISMREMLQIVPNLVAAGASDRELVAILTSESEKSRALMPLIVALRERQGETVRAPAEVREVAADVREQIDERVRNWAEATSVSPESGR